ncbi:endonuclease [Sagittula sp. P11]|nr:endonuclease [Sagittula sp. P11]
MSFAVAARAEGLRVATWHGDFSRKGPGLLFQDIVAGQVPLGPILDASPDVLLLTDMDYDGGLTALSALRDALREAGLDLPHVLAARPNTGRPTGLDLDGDGRLGGPRDAQGFGYFNGQGGMAVLARYPLTLERDLSELLWKDAPESLIAADDPGHDVQRLSTAAHWQVTVDTPHGPLALLTLAATPPVFDGPEDRNGRRNFDEAVLWLHVLNGRMDEVPQMPVILLGNLNVDPERGDGLREAARRVLGHDRLQDPIPGSDTVRWDSTGPMRVSYVLPDARFAVIGAGVTGPAADAGPHGLVWVDLAWPR